MTIGILKEPQGENRVSALPEVVASFIKLKAEVIIENGAGDHSFASDDDYKNIGATVSSRSEVISKADILLSINQPIENNFKEKAIVLGVYQPLFNFNL